MLWEESENSKESFKVISSTQKRTNSLSPLNQVVSERELEASTKGWGPVCHVWHACSYTGDKVVLMHENSNPMSQISLRSSSGSGDVRCVLLLDGIKLKICLVSDKTSLLKLSFNAGLSVLLSRKNVLQKGSMRRTKSGAKKDFMLLSFFSASLLL